MPRTRLVYIAIKPSIARWNLYPQMSATNRLIEGIIDDDPLLAFVDVATPMLAADGEPQSSLFVEDGLHLSDGGYALWTNLVRPQLNSSGARKNRSSIEERREVNR